ncbi:hypothetical protein Patl1_29866 [Pistacia atlantica]|uniref:Uncharacterized protein n=1 Tax=Pistacia atlantica TaxID=434234 RepID=A0ACC1AEM5_9ROSI|nr:hypothetical protein Patl1_29866 [Pistacia atlantica]
MVLYGVTRLEDRLLYAKRDRLYVPSKGGVRRALLKEVHDSPWAGHLEVFSRLVILKKRMVSVGQQPLTPIEIARQPTKGKFPTTDKVARDRQEIIDQAQDSLRKASKRMKKYDDAKRRPLEFDVGDQVLFKLTPQIWKKINSKRVHRALVPKYDGPFEVVSRVGAVAYKLKLPEWIKVHPTFHVSFLKPFHVDKDDSSRTQAKRAPPMIRKQFDDEIEKILDHSRMGQRKKNRRIEYLVKWKRGKDSEVS